MIANGDIYAHQSRIKSLFLIAAKIPHALVLHWQDRRQKRIVLAQVYTAVTTRCTLRCDKCLTHVPDLKCHEDAPADELIADLQALFSCIDYIYDLCLGGGEPLLHPDLDQILLACAASGKIGNIKVLTNGTVLPGANVLVALRDAKARVNISDYPNAPQPDFKKIQEVLKENEICYAVYPAVSGNWVDTDSFGQLKEGSPARRFSDCILRLYHVFVSGQLHLCCQSAILAYDGRRSVCREDYIDMRRASSDTFREELKKLNKKIVVSACSYCLGHDYKTPKIPVAVQREKESE